MTTPFNEEEITKTFDKLVKLQIIHYGDSVVVPLVDRGFPVSFTQHTLLLA